MKSFAEHCEDTLKEYLQACEEALDRANKGEQPYRLDDTDHIAIAWQRYISERTDQ